MLIAHINKATGEVEGTTVVSSWPDDVPYPTPSPDHENLIIEPEHPITTEHQADWRFDGKALVRKSEAEIEALKIARRKPPMRGEVEVLLDLINEMRLVAGQPAITIDDVRQRQRDVPIAERGNRE